MEHTYITNILFEARHNIGNTALHNYVLNHEFVPHVMESLIVNRAYLKKRNGSGKTAFLLAVVHRQEEMIEFFIKNRANVNVKDNFGNNALHYIALHEFNSYSNFNGDNSSGYGPADENRFRFDNQCKILKILLNAGVNVNSRNIRGDTPLMWAARGEHLEIVKLLLQSGANVHLRNHNMQTCLHVALNYGNPAHHLYIRYWKDVNYAIVLELVRNGACVNCFNKEKKPAFYYVLQVLPGINMSFPKELMKEAALVNWRGKIDLYLDEQRILGQPRFEVPFLVKCADVCSDEISRMRVHDLPGGSNLCLFARRGVSEDEKSNESEINEEVLKILLHETFPIYHEFILPRFNTSVLREKASEMGFYTIREKRNIRQKIDLKYHEILKISSYLENSDLFNLIFAFHQNTTI